MSKLILITGANKGIGYEIARQCGTLGFKVIISGRDEKRLKLAWELKDKKIAVNAACPGWVQTDMGGTGATRSVEKGAETPVWLASEASQELTGLFFRDRKVISW